MPKVYLSDKVQAVQAIAKEIETIEQNQIQLGFEMDKLIQKQVELSKKSNALSVAMDKLVRGGIYGTLH